ncbi:MAG: hypothetical protein E7213_07750 [Clostridium sp.]|nr:hypothetical protein [Clostridium sp.]
MKIKKMISIFLCFIFMFFLTTNYGQIDVDAQTDNKPILNLDSKGSDNYVHLSWTSPDKNSVYSYRVFSRNSKDAEFQSVPSKQFVKVLNIYPNKGDALKDWMEKPNNESDNGYGNGLISVDKVSIDEFNLNSESYLKGKDNKWMYDVLVFGFWDRNGDCDITSSAERIVEDFIKSGRGVLFGHDTLIPSARRNISSLAKYLNMDASGAGAYKHSTEVYISKKGLLTDYPWKIGDIGTVLTVPDTHVYYQKPYGEVWMNLSSDNQFYLTTWNNVAMIQTGHSNGLATPDEQKVLANTIFYLAQVTEETKCDEHKGQDLMAPTKPNIKKVTRSEKGNMMTVFIDESKDLGSSYDYYLEAKEESTGNTVKSDVKSVEVTSGLKGYSIVIDQNENTIPDAVVETTSTEYEVDNTFGNDFYIHVAAVDNAGNVSEVSTYKYSRPVLELTPSTTEEVKDKVTIRAKTLSTKKIEKIITPDGKKVDSDSTEYDVDVNGTYTFTAVDVDGNETTESITINNIKPDIILNVEPNMNKTHLREDFVVDLTINHIKSIYATEVRIKYDSSRLEFLGLDTIDGIELVNNDKSEGEITLLLASLGFENVLEDETLIKLNFTGIAAGDALIEVAKADVADGDFMEKTLRDAECGETTISIVDRELTSVDNKDKAFTLLDLSIIAKHYGEDPNALLLKGIDADLNLDGKIDKADYNKCYKLMLKNPNRKF